MNLEWNDLSRAAKNTDTSHPNKDTIKSDQSEVLKAWQQCLKSRSVSDHMAPPHQLCRVHFPYRSYQNLQKLLLLNNFHYTSYNTTNVILFLLRKMCVCVCGQHFPQIKCDPFCSSVSARSFHNLCFLGNKSLIINQTFEPTVNLKLTSYTYYILINSTEQSLTGNYPTLTIKTIRLNHFPWWVLICMRVCVCVCRWVGVGVSVPRLAPWEETPLYKPNAAVTEGAEKINKPAN